MDKGKLSILLAMFSLVLYPINDLACVGVIILALCVAIFGVKEKDVTKKVLQPTIVLGSAYLIRGVFAILLNIINNFARLSDTYYSTSLYDNSNKCSYVISALCLVLVLVFAVLIAVFYLLKKDTPVLGCVADRILGNENSKQSTSNKTEQTKVETKENNKSEQNK